MAKSRRVFVCTECDAQSASWTGRCTGCGAWASLTESVVGNGSAPARSTQGSSPLADVDRTSSIPVPTGLGEVDRVLGGGLMPGSVLLLSGEPGIGKSTLSQQIIHAMAASGAGVVLVTGEEAPAQVAGRADRLGTIPPSVGVLDVVDVHAVTALMESEKPQLVVVDSIQTVHDPDLDGAPGSVSQVRQVAGHLVAAAKGNNVTVLIIGHVTKDGSLAGPRQLEHVVDTVLTFEGDRQSDLRRLRALKHRFGSTTETGLFEMTLGGLQAVHDPSARFLSDRLTDIAGSMVVPVVEGHRPVLVELQTLVCEPGEGHPQRTVQGLPTSRLKMVLAVLGGRAGVNLTAHDVFVSIAGGVRSEDPGLDLGLALALASAAGNQAVPHDAVAIGEIGLAGEVRSVPRIDLRMQEAYRLGYRRALVPQSAPEGPAGLELVRCHEVHQAVDRVMAPLGAR